MCKLEEKNGCLPENFYCRTGRNNTYDQYLSRTCPFTDPDKIPNSTVFNFGIFTDLLSSEMAESRNFSEKFFYCFWWGLRNLRLANI